MAPAARKVEDRTLSPASSRFRCVIDVLNDLAQIEVGPPHQMEVVVHEGGNEVLRAWVGPTDVSDGSQPLTAVCGSAFKPVLAICLLRVLHDAGIDIDEPLGGCDVSLADGRTTVRHVVEHRAGLPHIRGIAPNPADLLDRQATLDALRQLPPLWEPGTRSAYHAISYGHLIEAICADLNPLPISELIWDLVLTPAGLSDQDVLLPWPEMPHPEPVDLVVTGQSPIPWRPDGRSLPYRTLYSLPELVAHLNSPRGRQEPILSCGVACTATALASVYDAVIGADHGSPWPQEVCRTLLAPGTPTFDRVMFQRLTWRAGTLSGAGVPSLIDRPRLVGLPGYGGSMGWGDADAGVTVGIISTLLEADRIVGQEAEAVCNAIADVL